MGSADKNPNPESDLGGKGTSAYVIKKGKHEKFFFISDKGEDQITRSLGWQVFGFLGGALLCLIAAIVLFIVLAGG